jgi:hypothetical protein
VEREIVNHQRALVAQRSHRLGVIGSAGKIERAASAQRWLTRRDLVKPSQQAVASGC